MVTHELLVKAAGAVLTGLVGVSAYETVRKALGTAPIRRASVTVMEWGLRGTRRAEAAAESARLTVADVVAEARGRIGEEAQLTVVSDAAGRMRVPSASTTVVTRRPWRQRAGAPPKTPDRTIPG